MAVEKKFVLPKVEQVAMAVKDLESTAAYLSSCLGIGPFQISDRYSSTMVHGKPTMAKRKVGIASMGGVDLELIQPMEEDTPYYDFMNSRGEGLQHIRFSPVDDLNQTVAYLEEKGFKLVYSGKQNSGVHSGSLFAYMESERAKGFILEFVQRPKA